MVNRIIISDNSTLEDLIIFKEPVKLIDIEVVMYKVRNTIGDYTFDDIYNAIDENFEIKETIDLSSTFRLYC